MLLNLQLRDLPDFRWRPGMLAILPETELREEVRARIYDVWPDGLVMGWVRSRRQVQITRDAVPDLTDDATGGVLLATLPESYHLHRLNGAWTLHDEGGNDVGASATLAEACARLMVARGRCSC